jgi:putative ABC transport system substrate-binding protein
MLSRYVKLSLLIVVTLTSSFTLTSCLNNESEVDHHFTIGLITNNPNGLKNITGFQDGMTDLGYIEGENVTYVFEGEPTGRDSIDAALQKMVESEVDLIFTAGTPTGIAAHRVTADTDTPVVFGVIANPLSAGIMEDLNRPNGNMTGVMLSQNQSRRLALLLEIAPEAKRIFVPFNPNNAAAVSALAQIQGEAINQGIEIVTSEAIDNDAMTLVINNIPNDIDAIFLLPDSVVNARLDDIMALAFERKLPVSGPCLPYVEGGALIAYGIIHYNVGAHATRIADQILKGAKPGELPVEIADYFLFINLKTASAINIEIPDTILQRAELIIRD